MTAALPHSNPTVCLYFCFVSLYEILKYKANVLHFLTHLMLVTQGKGLV